MTSLFLISKHLTDFIQTYKAKMHGDVEWDRMYGKCMYIEYSNVSSKLNLNVFFKKLFNYHQTTSCKTHKINMFIEEICISPDYGNA